MMLPVRILFIVRFFANKNSPSWLQSNKEQRSDGSLYKRWQNRILASSMVGYAGFYLIRQNFTMAVPSMQIEFGYTKTQIGLVITIAAIIYGVCKGFFGLLGDRSDARYFMAFGLFASSCMNIFVGFSSSLPLFLLFWSLNSCFQSMGWPPCARMLTHWFSPQELATKWAIWNTSQQIGGAIIVGISGFLVINCGWRSVFYVPGLIGIGISLFLLHALRDNPKKVGLRPIEEHEGLILPTLECEKENLSFRDILIDHVLKNKLVWYVSFANFFVYIVRMSIFNWAPTFLREFKGSTLSVAGFQSAVFDVFGMFGGILAGYLADTHFRGYRGRVGAIFMVCLTLSVILLWLSPPSFVLVQFLSMACVGFFVSGPQILVGVAASDFSSKKAAGAASGFTGFFGYLGTALTGVGLGYVVDSFGWNAAFLAIVISALCACCAFLLTWNHRSKFLDALEKRQEDQRS